MQVTCILEQSTYKPGDQAPEGYLAWHEWADTQHKAGLRQRECGRCSKWKYPQELSSQIDECVMQSRKGPVALKTPVCHKCADQAPAGSVGSNDGLADPEIVAWNAAVEGAKGEKLERPEGVGTADMREILGVAA